MATLPFKEIRATIVLLNGDEIEMNPINLKTAVKYNFPNHVTLSDKDKRLYVKDTVTKLNVIVETFNEFQAEEILSFSTKSGYDVTIKTSAIAATFIKRHPFKTNFFNRI